RIRNLLKPNRNYPSVAATAGKNLTFTDLRVYVLYDDGKEEPAMEEWGILDSCDAGGKDQTRPWMLKCKVPIK
ncbi:hypothetical protein V8F20_003327, partial [Naviculisporaceae sp. PSN 640]